MLTLSEGPDPGPAQRHVDAGSPIQTAPNFFIGHVSGRALSGIVPEPIPGLGLGFRVKGALQLLINRYD